MSQRDLHILLVDDDPVDRELFREALSGSGQACRLSEAGNGVEALHLLQGEGALPHLVVLDLNMPLMDGRETLRAIRAEGKWKGLSVCMLSTSSAHFDIESAYEDGANLFLVKPLDFRSLSRMLEALVRLFADHVALRR